MASLTIIKMDSEFDFSESPLSTQDWWGFFLGMYYAFVVRSFAEKDGRLVAVELAPAESVIEAEKLKEQLDALRQRLVQRNVTFAIELLTCLNVTGGIMKYRATPKKVELSKGVLAFDDWTTVAPV